MSSGSTSDAGAVLERWRQGGADRLDPIRFYLIEAMARRAAAHDGDARRLLDERLATLLHAYGADVERAQSSENDGARAAANDGIPSADDDTPSTDNSGIRSTTNDSVSEAGRDKPALTPLAGLIAHIDSRASADADDLASRDAAYRRSSYPDLVLVDYFRETWSKVSANRQLRQSQEDVPRNAGPLNSSHLVHRSLTLMRELSPGYLHQFLAYVDALSWLEQMHGVEGLAVKEAPRATPTKKTARGKQR